MSTVEQASAAVTQALIVAEPLHFSELKWMALSPAHVAYRRKLGWQPADTRDKRIGVAVHARILGGSYKVWDGTRRGNAWKDFEAEHEGKTILTAKEAAVADSMVSSAMRNADVLRMIKRAEAMELDLTWMDGKIGCAGRLDLHGQDLGRRFLLELKTGWIAEPKVARRRCIGMAYHAQLDWYACGLERSMDIRIDDHYIALIESKPPFPVTVFKLTARLMEEGRRLWRSWMEMYYVCASTGEWPEYTQGIIPLDIEEGIGIEFDNDGDE